MLASKRISLGSISENLAVDPIIIKSEDRDIVSSYEGYILKKTIEADAIIDQAHETAKVIARQTREEAEAEFWKYAQAFYNELQAMKASIIEEVEDQCREVVLACLSNVLDEVPDEDKVRPMIKSLLANKMDDDVATVYVHPDQLAAAEPVAAALCVPIQADDRLEPDAVMLKTDKNKYQSSFKGKLNLILRAIESN
ncbi:V-type proton ATPase subunit E [Thalassocella blandensis]|nr:V-type proton ATPase subunit E [Thalassocella blandensis]